MAEDGDQTQDPRAENRWFTAHCRSLGAQARSSAEAGECEQAREQIAQMRQLRAQGPDTAAAEYFAEEDPLARWERLSQQHVGELERQLKEARALARVLARMPKQPKLERLRETQERQAKLDLLSERSRYLDFEARRPWMIREVTASLDDARAKDESAHVLTFERQLARQRQRAAAPLESDFPEDTRAAIEGAANRARQVARRKGVEPLPAFTQPELRAFLARAECVCVQWRILAAQGEHPDSLVDWPRVLVELRAAQALATRVHAGIQAAHFAAMNLGVMLEKLSGAARYASGDAFSHAGDGTRSEFYHAARIAGGRRRINVERMEGAADDLRVKLGGSAPRWLFELLEGLRGGIAGIEGAPPRSRGRQVSRSVPEFIRSMADAWEANTGTAATAGKADSSPFAEFISVCAVFAGVPGGAFGKLLRPTLRKRRAERDRPGRVSTPNDS